MATVRLEVELDSEVYPELYAALSALRSARARGERFRQLASAGLVWENVRIYGAAAIGPTAGAPAAAFAAVPAAVPAPVNLPVTQPAPERAVGMPAPERRAPARARARAEPPPDLRSSDFIDLAIDAEPDADAAPPPKPRRAPRARAADATQGARDLPVLMDVVGEAASAVDRADLRTGPAPLTVVPSVRAPDDARALPVLRAEVDGFPAHAAAGLDDAESSELDDADLARLSTRRADDGSGGRQVPDHFAVASAVAARASGDGGAGLDPGELPSDGPATDLLALPDDAVHLTSLAQKPAARSRLLRMKERGLFKNG